MKLAHKVLSFAGPCICTTHCTTRYILIITVIMSFYRQEYGMARLRDLPRVPGLVIGGTLPTLGVLTPCTIENLCVTFDFPRT